MPHESPAHKPIRPATEASREPEASPDTPSPAGTGRRRSMGFWLLALALGVPAVAWVVQVEYVHSSIQIGNAVPPIPAVTALLLLGAIAAGIRSRRRRRPDSERSAILRVYLLLTFAAAIPSTSALTYLFANITVPAYLSNEGGIGRIASRLPTWYAPPPGDPIQRFFHGGSHSVPWDVWIRPLLAWGVFLFTLMLSLYALLALLRRSWMVHERLSYPIVQIPFQLVGEDRSPSLWRSPAFWIGFGLTAAYDGINMLHAFYPSAPAFGVGVDIGGWVTEKPWSVLSPLWVSFRPEILGIAYLMPTSVLLTTSVSYLLLRLSNVARFAAGEQIASTAYDYQEMGMGAFLFLFGLLLWRAKPELKRSLSAALKPGRDSANSDEPLSPRAAWLIVLLGPLLMLGGLSLAGLPVRFGAVHLLLLIAVAVVYARMRAETGTPMIYLFPFWQQQALLTNLFGSQALSGANGQALVVFTSLGGLSRGFYPEICAYGAEGMSLAGRARFPQCHVTSAVVLGTLLGLVVGGALYLRACYDRGASQLGGGYQIALVQQQYRHLDQLLRSPALPRPDLIFQTFLGGWIVLDLHLLRQRLLWFPFHPMGFAMAASYGYHLWAPFLVAWGIKSCIVRYGGLRGYRMFVPLFLGLALGRYLFTGILWGLLGMMGHPAVEGYQVHFS